ncbi:DUF3097 domain-containing protein [Rarobacter faecitabidus]|uniref:DUF3097 family protein n=1 Tax=Rarobacter faecitabidus TaxID=13243 RepID=A0A542ZV38_RARFA|nr:DUF3097 family protein [Rarobacter faecitabidus]TQL64169.1 DUF3097 family protein [Rarobacter faecitabidus]
MDRYGQDILSGGSAHHRRPVTSKKVPAARGLVVEEVTTGWVGAILRVEKSGGQRVVVLEDARGRRRTFPMGPGFWIDGKPVELVPVLAAPVNVRPVVTASGSVAVHDAPDRVAQPSRIWVEGAHDAELIEKIWGDDLRIEGVVVELLHGVDNLEEVLSVVRPTRESRIGVLVDHLVAGSKEDRAVSRVRSQWPADALLIVGHPFVDVWQAIKPEVAGLRNWPAVPRSMEWKRGILAALGRPNTTQEDVALGWKGLLGRVHSYKDLEPELLGPVENLIDFVTIDPVTA